MTDSPTANPRSRPPTHPSPTARIPTPPCPGFANALKGLRYGSVLAIVQDGVVVQIERTEKTRLDKLGR
ncbi:MAG: YezD family protein [Planctomycetia bacterium]